LTALMAGTTLADVPQRPFVVAVDIGHTTDAPGAISARGRSELEFNRDLALKLRDALKRRGMIVALVNPEHDISSLQARPRTVPDADFFISIHHDSVSERELREWQWQGETHTYSDRWAGHSMFVSRRNPDVVTSTLCSSAIGARLQRTGFTPTIKNGLWREDADSEHAVHYFDNLIVLYNAQQPAMLFEAGIIKNRDEELLLREPERQRRMAEEIATGLVACLTSRKP